jgi:hypothetical protein
MPPRSSLTSSFSVSDAQNEVVCPLKNHDGSACRKRCLGVSPLFLILPPSSSLPHPPNLSQLRHRQMLHSKLSTYEPMYTDMMNCRRSGTARCKSTSAAPTQTTTSLSSPPPRSPSPLWSTLPPLNARHSHRRTTTQVAATVSACRRRHNPTRRPSDRLVSIAAHRAYSLC